MSPLRFARTAGTLVLISAPVSLAAEALAAGETHASPRSRSAQRSLEDIFTLGASATAADMLTR